MIKHKKTDKREKGEWVEDLRRHCFSMQESEEQRRNNNRFKNWVVMEYRGLWRVVPL